MKAKTKTAAAVFSGTAAVALVVGFGVGVSPAGGAAESTTHSSSSVAPVETGATGAGVHLATLAGCVSDLDC